MKNEAGVEMMSSADVNALKSAVNLLENPSFVARLADLVGTPIEKAIALLPAKAAEGIGSATQKAILAALKVALKTMDYHDPSAGDPPESSDWWHKAATATSGAIGGAFGIFAVTVELPVSTTIIMRSIADVARSEGADLNNVETQLECMQVLAFGGPSGADDGADIGYFAAREAMAKAAADAAAHIAKNGLEAEGAPAIVRLILLIAERYSITVTEKVAAQLVPVIGAIGGALVNTAFMDHFQDMARGHFIVRRLERKYGEVLIRGKYAEFRDAQKR